MNFQDLLKVETTDTYLDMAFRKGKVKLDSLKGSLKRIKPVDKAKRMSVERINTMSGSLQKSFFKIINSFPDIDGLPEFYQELVKTQLEYVQLKKSLGAVDWASSKIKDFSRVYCGKIRASTEKSTIEKHIKEYFGRISSIVKRIDKNLKYLETSRKTMKNFPSVKTSLHTIALYGFPNVGKTTVLCKLTGAKAEIKAYSFTTKKINIGYLQTTHKKIQILDTPGTLARLDKMNDIELQAELALKYCADDIVFVFDVTYDYEKQISLLESLKKKHKRKITTVYFSKADLTEERPKIKGIEDIEELKKLILKHNN